MRGANNPHSKRGGCPRARAPLPLRLACLIAPVQRDRAPHAYRIPCSACPIPSRKPHPLWGGLTARIMCGCGRARRARLRGLRGLRCQRCAQTGDGATLRGALGLREATSVSKAHQARQNMRGALAALCAAVALRGRARPPPGTGVPVWRLRALRRAWATAACPSAHCSLRCLSGAGRAAAIGTACVGGLRYSACH